jgi:hypothetical protein
LERFSFGLLALIGDFTAVAGKKTWLKRYIWQSVETKAATILAGIVEAVNYILSIAPDGGQMG